VKIGIYMAYGPQTVLAREGLGRYIGNLIKGFVGSGHQVTIACPQWSLDAIDDLFQEFQIDANEVDFIVSNKVPVLWRLYEGRYKKRHPKRKLRYKILHSFTDLMQLAAAWLISITSMIFFALVVLVAALVGLLLLPAAILMILLLYTAKFVRAVLHKGSMSVKEIMQKIVNRFLIVSSAKKKDLHVFLTSKRDGIVNKDLTDKVNLAEERNVWFVPSIFWTEVEDIKGTKVLCAPDLVTEDFPALFADVDGSVSSTRRCRQLLKNERYFVTYCDYTKRNLMLEKYGKRDRQVVVIPHINNDMYEYIEISKELCKKLNSEKNFSFAYAQSMVTNARYRNCSVDAQYISSLNMKGMRFLFYASQWRPHKNMITLVKAYEYLLRKRHWNIKLILTATLPGLPVWEYIRNKRLEYDVLSFPNLSAQELAAFYRCADLVVNPTLYEGGFPFTFGEGMSVGTPSVMSDIPQVREIVVPFGLEKDMLFDPYDWKSMADKVEYALQNRDALYQKELSLYRELEKRTGSVVAEEYVHAFEYFIEQDKLAQKG